jgi:hypothetical protein
MHSPPEAYVPLGHSNLLYDLLVDGWHNKEDDRSKLEFDTEQSQPKKYAVELV